MASVKTPWEITSFMPTFEIKGILPEDSTVFLTLHVHTVFQGGTERV